MLNSLRKQLYQATKTGHTSVEGFFNFREKVTYEKLLLFYESLMKTRFHYQLVLEKLEQEVGVDTCNTSLLKSLKADIGGFILKPKASPQFNLNAAIGIFYVLAGSSIGAKYILNVVRATWPDRDFHYLQKLQETSVDQLSVLEKLLAFPDLDTQKVIISASKTFDFIYQTAHELQRKTTILERP